MSRLILIGFGAVLLCTLVCSILLLTSSDTDEGPLKRIEQKTSKPNSDEVTIIDEISLEKTSPSNRGLLTPKGFYIKGRVKEADTGNDILVFDLSIRKKQDSQWRSILHETIRSHKGQFNCPLSSCGEYSVTIRTSRHKRKVIEGIVLSEEARTRELVFLLDSGYRLNGVVRDNATKVPIKDAKVFPLFKKNDESFLQLMLGFEEHRLYAITNEAGEFSLQGLDSNKPVYVAAVHPQYAAGEAEGNPQNQNILEIRLKKGLRIYGKAYDDQEEPISKLLITVMGFNLPVPRYVFTGRNGAFKTAPIPPGRVFVRANQVPEQKNPRFTPETQMVILKNRDEEVIFGPSPIKVIWRGCFYDSNNIPVSHGKVEARPSELHAKSVRFFNAGAKTVCNAQGCFEFNKLMPGVYQVSAYLPGQAFPVDMGEMVLDKPGLIEKDLHLSGGRIHGTIVDEATGRPLLDSIAVIYASGSDKKGGFHRTKADKNGAFHFYGLKPGEYDLTASVTGLPSKTFKGYRINENQVLMNIKLPLSRGGQLLIRLCGFEALKGSKFVINWAPFHLKGKTKSKFDGKTGYVYDALDGQPVMEIERILSPGLYGAALEFYHLGLKEKSFEIFSNQTTLLEVFREDLEDFSGAPIDVTGTVRYQDGAALGGAYVVAQSDKIKGASGSSMAKSNPDGEFTLKNLRPGIWKVDVWVPKTSSKTSISCPDLVIQEGDSAPAPLDIVISISIIRGRALDATTGRPLCEITNSFSAVLMDGETQKVIAESYCGNKNSEFSFTGVKEGMYLITVSAEGYEEYRSDPIGLKTNQILNLNPIHLEPKD